ncbi:hypothetical protein D9V37_02370 [Nocardioides mangrovicus]|uniref:YoaR-like putative peptidoglycan binding domain-containing protein n=1 Tax=Nocardioides mangrovicus TaxID=2478913 RepID=A0A3L8P7A6_9ACTN|nr:VanW family protein [Nocardioides mangrovicus]RLV50822.1 hypothetical protein D9V37_02370 [Nocardioides mangrovicus]
MSPGKRRAVARHARSLPVRLAIGVWIFVVAGYVTLCLLAGDKVPAGTSVAGVEIGGLHATAAESRLREQLAPRFDRAVPVSGAGVVETTVVPSKAGVDLDVAETVRTAGGGRSFWPSRLWHYYVGGDHRPARLQVSRTRLDAQVTALAALLDKKTVEGSIGFSAGKPVAVTPEAGRRLDRTATARLLTRVPAGAVRLPYRTLPPTVTAAAVARAMSSFATPATSGPVQLVLGRHAVTAPATLFTKALALRAQGRQLVPVLDVDTLLTALEPLMTTVAGAPQSASFTISGGRPRVVPSKVGTTFDRDDLKQKFLDAVVRPVGQRRVAVKGVDAQPAFTTADARGLGIRRQVATLTTGFGYADYRNTNIARGVELLDGTVLKPGETFSFDHAIGPPTKDRGFTPGYELVRGVFTADSGAGLSQLATTLYAAAYRLGLKDAGHTNGAVHNDRLPLGLEVGVDYGKRDLRFTDDTRYGLLVTAAMTPSSPAGDGSLTVTLWSTKAWDVTTQVGRPYATVQPKVRHRKGADCSAVVGSAGYSVDVVRVFRKPGSSTVDHRDKTTTLYPPQNAVICSAP